MAGVSVVQRYSKEEPKKDQWPELPIANTSWCISNPILIVFQNKDLNCPVVWFSHSMVVVSTEDLIGC